MVYKLLNTHTHTHTHTDTFQMLFLSNYRGKKTYIDYALRANAFC